MTKSTLAFSASGDLSGVADMFPVARDGLAFTVSHGVTHHPSGLTGIVESDGLAGIGSTCFLSVMDFGEWFAQSHESSEKSPQSPSVMVFGERFLVEIDVDLGLVLQHPTWGLLGYGDTLAEAERMLIERGRDLGDVMTREDFDIKLDADGRRLREFAVGLRRASSIKKVSLPNG